MKKKLFRSFIVSLFVFTLFISVSNAELVPNTTYKSKGYSINSCNGTSDRYVKIFGNYTLLNVNYFLTNAYNGDSTSLDSFIAEVEADGQNIVIIKYSNEENYRFCIWDSSSCPVVHQKGGKNYIGFFSSDSSGVLQYNFYHGLLYNYVQASTNQHGYVNDSSIDLVYYSTTPVPLVTLNDETYNNYFITWDGTSYYYQSAPLGPEFSTELTDDEIADVVKNFSNSTYWKNRNSNYTGFFIQRNELNGYYAVYVVPYIVADNKSLDGIYIPAGISSSNFNALDYDSYSILFNDGNMGVVLPWQQWLREFKAYLSPDGVNFEYYGEIHMEEFGEQRIPMTTPIIYSNFVIPFKTLLGDTTNSFDEIVDSFTEEEEFNFSDLINSETGESYEFEDVPVVDDPVTHALREFFTDLIGYLSSAFELVISKIFNFSEYLLSEFGENVFTLLFAIIIEAFSALVAGISLLVRFAGFVLTLVAIPADSSLFNVLVDGSAWGTHFIEGLNFLKGLSWNNLNLWTFFECFVAALEVIWTVRIVRRHYSQVV